MNAQKLQDNFERILDDLSTIKTNQALLLEKHHTHLQITEDLRYKVDGNPGNGTTGLCQAVQEVRQDIQRDEKIITGAAGALFSLFMAWTKWK